MNLLLFRRVSHISWGETMLWPPKYFRGLNPLAKSKRAREITRRKKENPKRARTYRAFQTDKGVKTRTSS